jgi:hypothetical protein
MWPYSPEEEAEMRVELQVNFGTQDVEACAVVCDDYFYQIPLPS